ncbi:high-affinity K+ transport system ATPase subunit B [Arthrobacter sp. B3I9]|nr:high-affinity K+ transport system ATPase subunit B [Arthrobacter sp. B3I9]
MNRIIWMGIGVAIGVIAFRKVTAVQNTLGPEGLNRAVGRLADGLFDFADAVRDGMQERETELRGALGIDTGIDTGINAGTNAAIGSGASAAVGRDAVRR